MEGHITFLAEVGCLHLFLQQLVAHFAVTPLFFVILQLTNPVVHAVISLLVSGRTRQPLQGRSAVVGQHLDHKLSQKGQV